jgi:Curlin associated repeat
MPTATLSTYRTFNIGNQTTNSSFLFDRLGSDPADYNRINLESMGSGIDNNHMHVTLGGGDNFVWLDYEEYSRNNGVNAAGETTDSILLNGDANTYIAHYRRSSGSNLVGEVNGNDNLVSADFGDPYSIPAGQATNRVRHGINGNGNELYLYTTYNINGQTDVQIDGNDNFVQAGTNSWSATTPQSDNVDLNITGDRNRADVHANLSSTATVTVTGNDNYIAAHGNPNAQVTATQTGDGNSTTAFAASAVANVTVAGTNNLANLYASDEGSSINVTQTGSGNEIRDARSVYNMELNITQEGSGNVIDFLLANGGTGVDSVFNIAQRGNNNNIPLLMVYGTNQLDLTQLGDNNSASMYLEGNQNDISILQNAPSGQGNLLDVTYYGNNNTIDIIQDSTANGPKTFTGTFYVSNQDIVVHQY